jgi:hypothetical protein
MGGGAVLLGAATLVPVAALGSQSDFQGDEFSASATPNGTQVDCTNPAVLSVNVSLAPGTGSNIGANGVSLLATWTSNGVTIGTTRLSPPNDSDTIAGVVPCVAGQASWNGSVTFVWLKSNGQPATDHSTNPAPVEFTYVALPAS